MLLDLIREMENIGLEYKLVTLNRIDVPFDKFVCVVTIKDVYSCYIVQEGEVIDVARFNTSQSVIDFLTYYDLVLA